MFVDSQICTHAYVRNAVADFRGNPEVDERTCDFADLCGRYHKQDSRNHALQSRIRRACQRGDEEKLEAWTHFRFEVDEGQRVRL
jgi:hypothetical protein